MQTTLPAIPIAPRPAAARPPHRHFPWRQHLVVLVEHKYAALAAFLTVFIAFVLWTYLQTPLYRAEATIQVDSDTAKVLNIQDVLSADSRDQEYLNTQMKLIESRTLCEQVVQALQLDKNAEFLASAKGNTDLAGVLQSHLSVDPVRGSRLIEVHVDHNNPQVAALLANGVAQQYIKQNLDRRMGAATDAVRWLRAQADEYKLKLEKSEEALAQYRQTTHTVSVEDRQNIVVDKLKELNGAVTQAQRNRLAAEADWNVVKRQLDEGRNVTEIPAILSNPKVATIRQQLNEKQVQLAVLRERYKDQHPSIVALQAELKAINGKLTAACDEVVNALQSQYSIAKANEESLQGALKEQEQQALEMDSKQADYNTLKRNAEADSQIYNSIITRMKETGVAGKVESNNLRLVDRVQIPGTPFKPRKTRNLAMGIIFGLGAAAGVSFLMNSFDDKIKTYEDIDLLGLPLLTGVPRIELPDGSQNGRVLQLEPHSICAEAFRNLRATISLKPELNAAKSLLITSTAPGEGKSVVSANLAIAFASNRQRTLLIDCDLHHPVQQTVFRSGLGKGLSLYLTNHSKLEDVVEASDIPNLDVLQVGDVPPNAPELLSSDRIAELIQEACLQYDRVIIDSPPVTAVSDPLLLLPYVNGVVYVIGFGKVSRDVVSRSMQKLRDCGASLVGVVMNNIDQELHGYYYYPYHYSYYHKKGKRNGAA